MQQKTRRPGRPRRDEVGDVDERLMEATMRMVAHHGSGLTMNQIIEASGVSRRTVYARYPNKSSLIAAIMRRIVERGLVAKEVVPHADWKVGLLEFVRSTLVEVNYPETMMLRHVFMLDAASLEDVRPNIERVIAHRYAEPLIRYFGILADSGIVPRQDFPFAASAYCELILLEGHRLASMKPPNDKGDNGIDALAEKLVTLMCYGIGATRG